MNQLFCALNIVETGTIITNPDQKTTPVPNTIAPGNRKIRREKEQIFYELKRVKERSEI